MKPIQMINSVKRKRHAYLWSIFNSKCARCREGNMFKDKGSFQLRSFMKMNETCTVCGQKMEIEQGFYIGTAYVSYALTVAFSVSSFVAWWILIGLSISDNRIFWWLGANTVLLIIFQPYFMRLSRVIWLSIFVKYDTNWKKLNNQ